MDYFFFDNDNKMKLNLTSNPRWSEQKTCNDYLNTIFTKENTPVKEQTTIAENLEDLLGKDLEGLDKIENPINFLAEFREKSDGETVYSHLVLKLQAGEISKEKFLEGLNILNKKFEDFEDNYTDSTAYNSQKNNHLKYYGNDYSTIISNVERLLNRQESFEQNLQNGRFTRTDIDGIKKFVEKEYNYNLSDLAAAEILLSHAKSKCGIYDKKHNYQGIDMNKFQELCATGKFRGDSFSDYLKDVLAYNGYDDTLESINKTAEIIESEYERYNFDINKSEIADLVQKSNAAIQEAEVLLEVTQSEDSITIQNKKTGEQRVIDLAKLTENLSGKTESSIPNAIRDMNKRTLWEFAIEVKRLNTNNSNTNYGDYDPETDTINVNNRTKLYSLIHEMCHAIMATVIDGKNTFNEPLYKEFVETYKAEQTEHEAKGLKDCGASDYNYCAENIHEFSAEAGCLYLTGDSGSAFTIAKHFPKSYRLYVTLLEKILSQEDGRSI